MPIIFIVVFLWRDGADPSPPTQASSAAGDAASGGGQWEESFRRSGRGRTNRNKLKKTASGYILHENPES
jgi:hypothetical protein